MVTKIHNYAETLADDPPNRRRDGLSKLYFLSRSKWDLIQSIAVNEILHDGLVEPLVFNPFPIDILIHQILSLLKEQNGLTIQSITYEISKNAVFKNVSDNELKILLNHLEEQDLIQYSNREYIIGFEGERLINRKDFYAIFETKEDYSVIFKNKVIGSLPLNMQIRPDSNIFLAAKIWSIVEVDIKSKKIFVIKAQDGRKPKFDGEGLGRNAMIEDKMFELITTNYAPNNLEESSKDGLNEIRQEFSIFNIRLPKIERPVYIDGESIKFYPFAGNAVNLTLIALYQSLINQDAQWDYDGVAIEMKSTEKEIRQINEYIVSNPSNIDELLSLIISEKSENINTSKWSRYLPLSLKRKLLKQTYYDLDGTIDFIKNIELMAFYA